MSPVVRKSLYAGLALLFGALATYFSTGCGSALPPQAADALAKAQCAQALAVRVSPDTTIREALDIARELRECFEPAPAPPAADAGVE